MGGGKGELILNPLTLIQPKIASKGAVPSTICNFVIFLPQKDVFDNQLMQEEEPSSENVPKGEQARDSCKKPAVVNLSGKVEGKYGLPTNCHFLLKIFSLFSIFKVDSMVAICLDSSQKTALVTSNCT